MGLEYIQKDIPSDMVVVGGGDGGSISYLQYVYSQIIMMNLWLIVTSLKDMLGYSLTRKLRVKTDSLTNWTKICFCLVADH